MKIIAYSRIPPAVPFVHLGYLAASTTMTKPVPGLFVSGIILLVAAVSVSGKRLWHRRRSPASATGERVGAPKRVLLGYALLLPALLALGSAYWFGEKEIRYAHPKDATLEHIWILESRIAQVRKVSSNGEQAVALPMQEGEYDVSTAISMGPLYRKRRVCFDAWSMPLKLRVTQQDGELHYAVVSTGPDRMMGTPDDITSANAQAD